MGYKIKYFMPQWNKIWGGFFLAPLAVAFFSIVIVLQIAAIKLVGGFFNAKAVNFDYTQSNNIASSHFYYPELLVNNSSLDYNAKIVKIAQVCGQILNWTIVIGFLVPLILVKTCLLFLCRNLINISLFESDCIRTRPPTLF
jgi:hypothetical protein